MDAFAYACVSVNKPLVDINDQWKPYIPVWYLNRPTSNTPTSTATTVSNTATAINSDVTSHISKGTVSGIAVAGVLAFGAMITCGVSYWRGRKKLKRKSKETAEIADALQVNGITQRIDQLNYRRPSNGDAVAPPAQHDAYGYPKPQSAEEHYVPEYPDNNQRSHSQVSLGTTAVATSPYLYQRYRSPAEYDRSFGVDGYPLRIPKARPSQDRQGMSALTATPIQKNSINAYQAYRPFVGHKRGVGKRPPHRDIPHASSDNLGKMAVTESYGQKHPHAMEDSHTPSGFDAIQSAKPAYDEYGKKAFYR
jgi:hypothetical protein